MPFSATITLTIAGTDTGPFDLYSNIDGFTVPFENNVAKLDLEAGYTSSLIPDSTSTVRVKSDNVICSNYIDLSVPTTTTTSTSSTSTSSTTSTTTTTAPDPPTADLIFTSYIMGEFTFTLSVPIPSTNTVINLARVFGSSGGACAEKEEVDDLTTAITIVGGNVSGSAMGDTPLTCSSISYNRDNPIRVNGILRNNGQTITIGGTLVTVVISSSCEAYIC